MSNSSLLPILKSVSRSFYLSMRILPRGMRESIAIAYLLARAADTIADTAAIDREHRLSYLHLFRSFILMDYHTEDIRKLCNALVPQISESSEKNLLESIENILDLFHNLPSEDFSSVQKVIATLTEGMVIDLNTFIEPNGIVALKTHDDLENYTYLVAGCVGEFWTTLSLQHVHSIKHWDKNHYQLLGIEFGKALQLTNIIRDVAKDARLGRSYIPEHALKSNGLNTALLLDKNNDHLLRPLIHDLIQHALEYFGSAELYFLSIPRRAFRLRLAALWPILIGIKTLAKISKKGNFLDPDISIKVSRAWVYRMLLISLICVFSNSLTKRWIKILRNSIESNKTH